VARVANVGLERVPENCSVHLLRPDHGPILDAHEDHAVAPKVPLGCDR
jgi:hypothetical protein